MEAKEYFADADSAVDRAWTYLHRAGDAYDKRDAKEMADQIRRAQVEVQIAYSKIVAVLVLEGEEIPTY